MLKPGLVKGQWSAQEDAMLVTLVSEGFKNWGRVTRFTFIAHFVNSSDRLNQCFLPFANHPTVSFIPLP